jgi:hypothetical protein
MDKEDDIDSLLDELNKLRIQETKIIERIVQVRNDNSDNNETTKTNRKNTNEEIRIGDTVRILNPRRFQESTGTVSRIGKRITITPRLGIKIVRDPKNVQKIHS